jgi:hypothetical protein
MDSARECLPTLLYDWPAVASGQEYMVVMANAEVLVPDGRSDVVVSRRDVLSEDCGGSGLQAGIHDRVFRALRDPSEPFGALRRAQKHETRQDGGPASK